MSTRKETSEQVRERLYREEQKRALLEILMIILIVHKLVCLILPE